MVAVPARRLRAVNNLGSSVISCQHRVGAGNPHVVIGPERVAWVLLKGKAGELVGAIGSMRVGHERARCTRLQCHTVCATWLAVHTIDGTHN